MLEGRLRQAYQRGNDQDVWIMSILRAERHPGGQTVSTLRLFEGKECIAA